MSARRAGVHVQGPGAAGGGFVVLDVALSPLLHGLPAEAAPLGRWLAACMLLVALALFAVPVGGLERHPAKRFLDKRQQQAVQQAAAAVAPKAVWT